MVAMPSTMRNCADFLSSMPISNHITTRSLVGSELLAKRTTSASIFRIMSIFRDPYPSMRIAHDCMSATKEIAMFSLKNIGSGWGDRATPLSRKAVMDAGGVDIAAVALWGCPNGAFYTPSLTLSRCVAHEKFSYRPGFFASHFRLAADLEIEHLVGYSLSSGRQEIFRADAYVLACGAVSSANIVLRSVYKSTGEIISLTGLTNNRQVLAPFVNLAMLGGRYSSETYQYHQLAVGFDTGNPTEYIHGQITALKTATVHPIVQNLPLDLRTANSVFCSLRSGLALLSLFFCDYRRKESYVTLKPLARNGKDGEWPVLSIHYSPARR